jgi:hypothetical protein
MQTIYLPFSCQVGLKIAMILFMFKLIKLLISFVLFASFAYFTFFVSLGDKTLYHHMLDISDTREAKALGNGIKEKALDVKNEVTQHVPAIAESALDSDAGKKEANVQVKTDKKSNISRPSEQPVTLTNRDKEALAKLLKSKL